MAVHIGSRVAALAGPGEVLVTGSVRDLMTGSDRQFTGGETRELKGVAEPWRVYRLVPDGGRRGPVASRRPAMVPLYSRRYRRRLVVGLAGCWSRPSRCPAWLPADPARTPAWRSGRTRSG